MATKKTQTFVVGAKIKGELSVEIQAADWEEALEKARELSFTDFAAILGDANDYDKPEIRSIYLND